MKLVANAWTRRAPCRPSAAIDPRSALVLVSSSGCRLARLIWAWPVPAARENPGRFATSMRCPSGSPDVARISRPLSFGGVRTRAGEHFTLHLSPAISLRMFRKLLKLVGSRALRSVTLRLFVCRPPAVVEHPLLRRATIAGSPSSTRLAPEYVLYRSGGTASRRRNTSSVWHNAFFRWRERGHLEPPVRWVITVN